VGKHRDALWKSLVLPAGGAGLCWLLLMTLWMPLLDHAQSYTALVSNTRQALAANTAHAESCIAVRYLPQGTIAALSSYGGLRLQPLTPETDCPWLATEANDTGVVPDWAEAAGWVPYHLIGNAVGHNEDFWLLQRKP
jgi:hypothetical protein